MGEGDWKEKQERVKTVRTRVCVSKESKGEKGERRAKGEEEGEEEEERRAKGEEEVSEGKIENRIKLT